MDFKNGRMSHDYALDDRLNLFNNRFLYPAKAGHGDENRVDGMYSHARSLHQLRMFYMSVVDPSDSARRCNDALVPVTAYEIARKKAE